MALFRFVRASKFRHVHGAIAKKEKSFQGVKAETTGEGKLLLLAFLSLEPLSRSPSFFPPRSQVTISLPLPLTGRWHCRVVVVRCSPVSTKLWAVLTWTTKSTFTKPRYDWPLIKL